MVDKLKKVLEEVRDSLYKTRGDCADTIRILDREIKKLEKGSQKGSQK